MAGSARHDVIVVGGRVAGAATSLLLARAGLRVLLVDRVRFPSDTVSSHQVQVPGVALLHRWGLLDAVRAAGTPPTSTIRFDAGYAVLHGRLPSYGGVDAMFSPRRTLLDALLVDAARAAGAEVRERFRVTELIWSGDRVTGIRGSERGGTQIAERARLVIGADGKRSFVARAVGAASYRSCAVRAFACYSYWAGVPAEHGEMYQRPGRAVAVFPTNDELTVVYATAPMTEFATGRADPEAHVLRTLDRCGDLGDRVRAGTRAERLRCTPDQPNHMRVPHGPGWALVGDAGVTMDSITAQGITHALRDADLLAPAVVDGLRGDDARLDAALAGHHHRRDAAIRNMYDFTVSLAEFTPPDAAQRRLLAALQRSQAETDRFLAAFAGVEPVGTYFGPANVLRTLGVRGTLALATDAARGRLGRRLTPRARAVKGTGSRS